MLKYFIFLLLSFLSSSYAAEACKSYEGMEVTPGMCAMMPNMCGCEVFKTSPKTSKKKRNRLDTFNPFPSQTPGMEEYEKPLRQGIQVFRAYVESWYSGEFQDIIFSQHQNDKIRRMIASLLAGYAWDQSNPIHKNAKQRLMTLAEYCRADLAQDTLIEVE